MAGSFAVEARGIGYQYGNHLALSDLNLAVNAGEIVGLLGTNGAGKTTTLKLLCGLLQPTTGTLSVLGHPVSDALPRVGVVAENPAFYAHMTVLENLGLASVYAGQQMTRAELKGYLSLVGLEREKGRVKGFSLGMRRRLALAMALAKKPDLLLLDEPTNGLDIDGVGLFRNPLEHRRGLLESRTH